MNKLSIVSLIAAGLLSLQSPDAAAHGKHHAKAVSHGYYARDAYRPERRPGVHRRMHGHKQFIRSHKMPGWLKRHRSFKNWYRYSWHSQDRRLSWDQLFDFYLWEQRRRHYRRH